MARLPAAIAVLCISYCANAATFTMDTEFGAAFGGYNDIRVPGDTGTPFSLTGDLDDEMALYFRLRPGLSLGERHSLSLLIAPFRLEAGGTLETDLDFDGTLFPAGTPIDASYRFDSYRVTYRYRVLSSHSADIHVGASAKIRDAAIILESPSAGLSAAEKNTGFVPLLSFRMEYRPGGAVHLLMDGDALVGPQGRAEDIFAGAVYGLSDVSSVRLGYRILEGGADVESVYNFTLVHFLSMGASVRF